MRPRRAPRLTAAGLWLVPAAALAGNPSATDPAGPQAARILSLGQLLWWVCGAVWVAVVAVMLVAVLRRRRDAAHEALPEVQPHEVPPGGGALPLPAGQHRTLTRAVAAATALTVLILLVFLGKTVATGHALAAFAEHHEAVTVEVTGHQWWWELRYQHPEAGRIFTTANELHVPVGQPVLLKLNSGDVIHSFWVPNLHGKRDLIPGQTNSLMIQADRPGIYEGQCAEFCGFQHANMRLRVVAESPEAFQSWWQHQLGPGRTPVSDLEKRGQEVFLTGPCVTCHSIAGTPAGGTTGPNLTHVASRRSLAANALPHSRGHLAGWVVNPQGIKPGVNMPPNTLPPADLQALITYLETLQ